MKTKLFKGFLTIVLIVLASLPSIGFVMARNAMSPDGFWQNLIVYGIGIWLLGGLQIIFATVGILFIVAVWES